MSDSNRVQISYIKEVTRGTTPAGNLQVMPLTSHSLQTTAQTTQSGIIRQDGNVQASVRTDMSPGGAINTEIGHEYCDELIESAFRSSFETPISLSGTTFSIDASGSPVTLDDSGNGLGAIKSNDILLLGGFAPSGDNGAFLVGENTAAGSVDIIPFVSDNTPTTEAAGDTVTIKTTRMENANTSSFFSVEEFNDLTNVYRAWTGMEVDQFTASFPAGAPATYSFTFLGDSEVDTSTTIGDGYDAAPTNDVIDTENGYQGTLIGLNGAAVDAPSACVTGITYSVANSVRREKGLNCVTVGKGNFNCTANVTMVFANKDVYNVFLRDQNISLASVALDGDNQGIGIVLAKGEVTNASVPLSGPNSTLIATFDIQGVVSTVGSDTYTAIFSKLG